MSFKYKTIKSIDLLKSFLLKQLEINKDIKIISFDVFDTLVHRRIYHDAIVEAVSQNLSNILSEINIHQKVNCLEARHRVYRRLIDIKVNQGKDFDVSLDDLVLPWVREVVGKEFDGDRAISKKIARVFTKYLSAEKGLSFGFIPTSNDDLVWFMQFDVRLFELQEDSPDKLSAFCCLHLSF